MKQSSIHRDIVEEAISLANTVLETDTSYSLTPSWKRDQHGMFPVYLLDGESLQDSEYVFVPKECSHCIFIQSSSLPELFDLFGMDYTEPPDVEAVRVLALVLLHEVGHISMGTVGSYTDYQKLTFGEITDIAGSTKNVELGADKFAAQKLKAGLDLLPKMLQQTEEFGRRLPKLSDDESDRQTKEFVAQQREEQRYAKAAADLASVLMFVTIKIASEKYIRTHPLSPRGEYTHLDFDLRVMILYHLIHPEGHFDNAVRYYLLRRTMP